MRHTVMLDPRSCLVMSVSFLTDETVPGTL